MIRFLYIWNGPPHLPPRSDPVFQRTMRSGVGLLGNVLDPLTLDFTCRLTRTIFNNPQKAVVERGGGVEHSVLAGIGN